MKVTTTYKDEYGKRWHGEEEILDINIFDPVEVAAAVMKKAEEIYQYYDNVEVEGRCFFYSEHEVFSVKIGILDEKKKGKK